MSIVNIEELGEKIQQNQALGMDFNFNADSYSINIKFNDDYAYIYTAIENLTDYSKIDRTRRLNHYARLNTKVLGYMCSTLAYNKNNEVIIHQWLNKNIKINNLLLAIDHLLQHADILTDSHY